MSEAGGIYNGLTVGEAEYRDGWHRGREAGEYDARHYASSVHDHIAEAEASKASGSFRTRAYWLGWLRGYREVVR